MQVRLSNKFITTNVIVILFAYLLTSCFGTGEGTITGSTSGSSENSSASVQLTKFQGVASASWVVDSGTNAIQTTSTVVTFEGTCSRGIETIKVKYKPQASGTYTTHASTATCTAQAFSWSGLTLGGDNTYDFQIYGVNGTGTELTDSAYTRKIMVDSTPPADPTALTVNGTGVANGGSITITSTSAPAIVGTISNDTKTMAVSTACTGHPGFTATDYTGIGSFTYNTSFSGGSTCVFDFRARDTLNNQSGAYTVTVSYNSPLSNSPQKFSFTAAAAYPKTTVGGNSLAGVSIGSMSGGMIVVGGQGSMSPGSGPFVGLTQ